MCACTERIFITHIFFQKNPIVKKIRQIFCRQLLVEEKVSILYIHSRISPSPPEIGFRIIPLLKPDIQHVILLPWRTGHEGNSGENKYNLNVFKHIDKVAAEFSSSTRSGYR